jgi:transposase
MPHLHAVSRDEMLLFPPSLDEYITDDNPVRFIDAFVDQLDLQTLGFSRAVASPLGRPAYHPGDLLKLYIYGYLNRVRSSRLLEREAQRNVEVIWLLKKLTPDFKTIADFRKDNLLPLELAFRVRAQECYELIYPVLSSVCRRRHCCALLRCQLVRGWLVLRACSQLYPIA